MDTVPSEDRGPSDGELIEAVRHGSTDAYRRLYERHVDAARNMARQVARTPAEVDDLVSEAFTKMLDGLRAGRGPRTSFRAYLLTTVRHTAYDRNQREAKLRLAGDVSTLLGANAGESFTDTAVAGLERSLIARAFARLPERWQTVLWHVEIEGERPAEVAPLLGMTPNGVSALLYRAREGLRQAYLQAHVGNLDSSAPEFRHCRAALDRLGAWTRGALSKRETAQVDKHLDGCPRCRALAMELADVNEGLRGVVAPLVLGSAAAGYLATSGGASTGAVAGAAVSGSGVASTHAVPRQTATAGMSCAAMVAVVAIALSSNPETLRPASQPPPSTPPPTTSNPPVPPPPEQSRTPEPSPHPPPPPPARPNLDASFPGQPVELTAGGAPAELPLTLRNSGGAPSEPVSVTLTLPHGVSAEPAAALGARSKTAASAPDPDCTGTDDGLRCTLPSVPAGATRTLTLSLRADEEARGGEIVTRVSAGRAMDTHLPPVRVLVAPEPPVDGVEVEARGTNFVPRVTGRLDLDVRNTGTSTGEAVAVLEIPDEVEATGIPPHCELTGLGEDRLRCSAELEPGDSFHGVVWLTALPRDEDTGVLTIPAEATLASARDTDSVALRWRFPWKGPDCEEAMLDRHLPIDVLPCPPPEGDFGAEQPEQLPGTETRSPVEDDGGP